MKARNDLLKPIELVFSETPANIGTQATERTAKPHRTAVARVSIHSSRSSLVQNLSAMDAADTAPPGHQAGTTGRGAKRRHSMTSARRHLFRSEWSTCRRSGRGFVGSSATVTLQCRLIETALTHSGVLQVDD